MEDNSRASGDEVEVKGSPQSQTFGLILNWTESLGLHFNPLRKSKRVCVCVLCVFVCACIHACLPVWYVLL